MSEYTMQSTVSSQPPRQICTHFRLFCSPPPRESRVSCYSVNCATFLHMRSLKVYDQSLCACLIYLTLKYHGNVFFSKTPNGLRNEPSKMHFHQWKYSYVAINENIPMQSCICSWYYYYVVYLNSYLLNFNSLLKSINMSKWKWFHHLMKRHRLYETSFGMSIIYPNVCSVYTLLLFAVD